MKNLNEPRRNELAETRSEGRVLSMENRRIGKSTDQESLVASPQMEDLRSRWTAIQASFVDEPRKAVQEADALISVAIKQIEDTFHGQKSQIEKGVGEGSEASTEELRVMLQRYRELFDRLLSI